MHEHPLISSVLRYFFFLDGALVYLCFVVYYIDFHHMERVEIGPVSSANVEYICNVCM